MTESGRQQVVLTGIDVPYWDLVVLLFKLFFAGIPVLILLWMIRLGLAT